MWTVVGLVKILKNNQNFGAKMSSINDLLSQVTDAGLRTKLEAEINKLTRHKKFGLVFEDHLPERTPLFDIPVKKNSRVTLKNSKTSDVFYVLSLKDGKALCKKPDSEEIESIAVGDLVPVAEFGEPIYPYLKPIDSVCNGDENEVWHTLIEADNYHALQLLEYLYAGKVDCIYIDPPYNTGARDWKYNNDYVDNNDAYRHSKWLSMMQKRLQLAKKLLNPKDSVLIVTIDEKEYLHLGCLLEEMFPNAEIQMVTSVISAKGTVRPGKFSRVEEHIFFVTLGDIQVANKEINMLDEEIKKQENRSIEWLGLRRRQPSNVRSARPNQFYPIFVNNETGLIESIGDAITYEVDRNTVIAPEGCSAVWPLSSTGQEMLWGLTPGATRANWKKGYVKVNWDASKKKGTVYYLARGTIDAIESGEATTVGYENDGSIIAFYSRKGVCPPKRVWNVKAHNAEVYGTNIVRELIGNAKFTFPKSIYAVKDTIGFYVSNKPNAIVIDFFAGSGTTLHAVNLLNAEDGGNRHCIMVTNNEVSENEAKALTKQGYQPGDEEWEKLGIARYVTWPRTVCSIEGHDVDGNPLKGSYLGNDRPMAEGFKANAAFFKLGFLDKTSVALGRQFKELLPVLWMKSGCFGPCPSLGDEGLPEMLVLPQNRMAVLLVESAFEGFKEAVEKSPEIQSVYLVTDYEGSYQAMSKQLNVSETYQLYRDYLDNFRINHSRG